LPRGINGNNIGGDAGNMPVKDGFATKMALHDALQCFEKDSDIEFIKEVRHPQRSWWLDECDRPKGGWTSLKMSVFS